MNRGAAQPMNPNRVAIIVTVSFAWTTAWTQTPTQQRLETFDKDPGWDARNNRMVDPDPPIVRQRFGWSDTNLAGEATGEIGGVVWRSARPAHYGLELENLSLDDPLECSGSFSLSQVTEINQFHTGSAINVGFFNSKEQGWRPIHFLGYRLLGHRDYEFSDYKGVQVGALVELVFGTSRYAAQGFIIERSPDPNGKLMRNLDQTQVLRILPDGSRHTWKLSYNPTARGQDGEMRFILDGEIDRTLRVSEGYKLQGATFDRFGIFNEQLPGYQMTGFFDDITVNGRKFDFSEDPGWEGVGNTDTFIDRVQYGVNDFGYSSTHNAGGKGSGEIGGRLFNVHSDQDYIKAHYGGPVGRLTMEDNLYARGKIAFPTFGVDAAMNIGWFNSEEQGWPTKNFVGVYLDSLTSNGRFVAPTYGTSGGEGDTGPVKILFLPDGRVYDWTLSFDPEAADGRGTVTFTLGDQSQTLELKEGDRRKGAVFNRFGLFNSQGNNGKFCNVYMDDIEYTVRPE